MEVVNLLGQRGHGHHLGVAVGQIFVNLIGHDDDVLPDRHLADGAQLLFGVDGTRGVVRGGDDDHLGAGGHVLLELLGGDLPAVLRRGGHDDGHAAAELHHAGVAHPVGGGDDDFIALVEDGAHGLVLCGLGAGGYANLVDVVLQSVIALELVANRLAQSRQTDGGGVLGLPLVERLDGSLFDVVGRVFVGLAAGKAENLLAARLHLLGLVGDSQRQRGGQGSNIIRNQFHGRGAFVVKVQVGAAAELMPAAQRPRY